MEPDMINLIAGGGVSVLIIDRITTLVVKVMGRNGRNRPGLESSDLIVAIGELAESSKEVASSMERIAKLQAKDHVLQTELHAAHLGPGAYDTANRLRWHGVGIEEGQKDLLKEMKDGNRRIVEALQTRGNA